jgi:DNA-binding NarL/FixJ family response regulator
MLYTMAGGKRTAAKTAVGVLIVDDHPLWRQTLRDLLDAIKGVRVVAEAGDGLTAVAEAKRHAPDVVVMDLDLPNLSGIDAIGRIRASCPDAKVLVLSSSAVGDVVREAVRAGACGYLVKTADPGEIADAVARIHQGELVFPPALTKFVLAELQSEPAPALSDDVRIALVGGAAPQREALANALAGRGLDVRAVASTNALPVAGDVSVVVADLSAGDRPATRAAVAHLREQQPDLGLVLLLDRAAPDATELEPYDGTGGVAFLFADQLEGLAGLHGVIGQVVRGETVVDPEIAHALVRRRRGTSTLDLLTDRERSVLALMAEGQSNQGIAATLSLSAKTIETHIASIFTKLDLDPTADHHRRVLAVVAYLQAS